MKLILFFIIFMGTVNYTFSRLSFQKISPISSNNAWFGFSVAIDGYNIIVGAPYDSDKGDSAGAAYLYSLESDLWVEKAEIFADTPGIRNRFGWAVAISGNYAVVGAPWNKDLGDSAGAAYVFKNNAGVWSQTAKLLAGDGVTKDLFGSSVAIQDSEIFVGAEMKRRPGWNWRIGAVYIYHKVGENWLQKQMIMYPDSIGFVRFGSAISVDNDVLLVGAKLDNQIDSATGAVFVIRRIGSVWNISQKITTNDANLKYSQFGWAVNVNNGSAIIGACRDWRGYGAAYLFTHNLSNDSFVYSSKISEDLPVTVNMYSYSVGLDSFVCIVGSPDNYRNGVGTLFIYKKQSSIWQPDTFLNLSEASKLGYSSSVQGNFIVAGAPLANNSSLIGTGAIYVFNLSDSPTITNNSGMNPLQPYLSQNYPNPFNPSTNIDFSIPKPGPVSLSVYNIKGQQIAILVNEFREQGKYTVKWAPQGVRSGLYFFRLKAGKNILIIKGLFIK